MAQNEASKRAASALTIAQHKFKQALKKDDNHESRLPPVAVELSAQFLSDVDTALRQNTPANVQKCTAWIVKHVASSRTRIASLGDYLTSISKSIIVEDGRIAAPSAAKSASRRRFVPLLIVNDVLHADKYHPRSPAKTAIFGKESMAYIAELVELAATYISEKDTVLEKRLRAILNYWALNHLLGADDIKSLQNQADEALLIAQGGRPVRKRNYLLPEYHGDRYAPWHDLPASYMLEQMIKRPNRPIDPTRIKVAKLDKKPVSAHVRQLLDHYFENIDLKYVPTGANPTGETLKYKLWLDPMGQLVKQNKETGQTDTVCNGYGWSLKLCQDMQKDGVPHNIKAAREESQREMEMEGLRPAPQQRKSHRRSSASPRRRRYSSPESDYRRHGRSHSRNRRSSRSSYDSRSPSRSHDRLRSRSGRRTPPRQTRRPSPDRGRSRYDDAQRDQQRQNNRTYSGNSSNAGQQWNAPDVPRDQGMSNPNQYPPPPPPVSQSYSQASPLPFGAPPFPPPPPPPPVMPNQFGGQFPMPNFPPPPFQPGTFPGGIPPPPPPPPNYSGPYPPPPPNVAAMPNHGYPFGGAQSGNNHSHGNGNTTGRGQNHVHQGGWGGYRGGGGYGWR
ncbi:hypothetical protein ACEQ8H_005486 [Pleosporales sp. CAS-2024a]